MVLEGEALWDFTGRHVRFTGGMISIRSSGSVQVRQSPGVSGSGKIENSGMFNIAMTIPAEFSFHVSQFVNLAGATYNVGASPPSFTNIQSKVTNEGTFNVAAGNVLYFDGTSDHEDRDQGEISLQEGSKLVVKGGQVKPRIVSSSGDTISEGGNLDLSALKVNSLKITGGTVSTGNRFECQTLDISQDGELVLRDETIVDTLTMDGGVISGPGQITITEWIWKSGRVDVSRSARSTIIVNSFRLESGEHKFLGRDTSVEGSSLWVDTHIEITLAKDLKFSQDSSLDIVSSVVAIHSNGGIFENSGNIMAALIQGRLAFYGSFHNKGNNFST